MDIRAFWPEITDEEIGVLQTLSSYEWLIARRLYEGRRIGGREISQDDLIQGFPKDKLGKAREAVKALEKKEILVKKPKPTARIYQAPPDFFTDRVVTKFIKKITEGHALRDSLINETLVLTKTSEALKTFVNKMLSSNRNIIEQKITISERVAFDGNMGLRVFLKVRCEDGGCFEIEYDVVNPRDMNVLSFESDCTCGSVHYCSASGRIGGAHSK